MLDDAENSTKNGTVHIVLQTNKRAEKYSTQFQIWAMLTLKANNTLRNMSIKHSLYGSLGMIY